MSRLLWSPSEERIKSSNLYLFMNFVNEKHLQKFTDYESLYRWSVEHIPEFWAAVWEFVEIKASKHYEQVCDDPGKILGAKWFKGAKLNFAENLLRFRNDKVALRFRGENGQSRSLTYGELYDEVARLSKSLKEVGVVEGDRVVGFMPNIPETVIAMLAAASLGAVWSSCSPDFGIQGVLDRFGQIRPKILFTADGYTFKGKTFDSLERVSAVVEKLPHLEKIIVVPFTGRDLDIHNLPKALSFEDFRSTEVSLDIDFLQLPFEHPLFIMYSSGTTGLPKCMIQSAGGVLINHLKELCLHTDLKREDKIFYYTTCGWMMWNWLVSSLALGATVVLFDGNPFHPVPDALWKMAEEEQVSIFGTSAAYLSFIQSSGACPGKDYNLTHLKAILSTGSPLSTENFEFVYSQIKRDLQLSSISGGTDINGCFALGNPMGPVFSGELQCRGLGMKVSAFNEEGKPVINRKGELVCEAPAPSMPIAFWDDPENHKYVSAYFDVYPNVWRHGDYVEINERGGLIIYGRSDATLNPGGVRIGTADIYRLVEAFRETEDSVVVGQDWKEDIRVVLFIKMTKGYHLTDELKKMIRTTIRNAASPRHVPAKIFEVPDIPYTLNMKKVELAVKKVIQGQEVKNKDSLKNPEVLDYYAGLKGLQED